MAEMQAPMRNVSLRDNSSRVMPHLAHGHAHDMNMDMDMDMDMDCAVMIEGCIGAGNLVALFQGKVDPV